MKSGDLLKRMRIVWVALLALILTFSIGAGASAAEKKVSDKSKPGGVRLMEEGDEEEETFSWSVPDEPVVMHVAKWDYAYLSAWEYIEYEGYFEDDPQFFWYQEGETRGEEGDSYYYTDELTESQTWYCDVVYEGETKTIQFILTIADWYLDNDYYHEYTKKDADAGRKITLDPEVRGLKAGQTPSFTWFEEVEDAYGDYDWAEITGATGATYLAPCKPAYYMVEVTLDGFTQTASFEVSLNTNFTVENDDEEEVLVASGADAVLKVDASNDLGPDSIRYEWSRLVGQDEDGDDEWQTISGAASARYVVQNVTKFGEYRCYAYDTYGNGESVRFIVSVENGFDAEAEDPDIYVLPGEDVTLRVIAEADQSEPLTYEWYVSGSKQAGADTDAFTVSNVTKNVWAECRVTDKYGYKKEVSFRVGVDNELEIEADDDDVTVPKGSPAMLSVEASCARGEIKYTWEKMAYNAEEDEWTSTELTGETSESLNIASVDTYERYRCTAHDDYGNEDSVEIEVHPESGLKIEDSWEYITVEPNQTALLKMDAQANEGEPLTYTWEIEGEEENLTADGANYTTGPIDGRITYYGTVTDQYGYYIRKEFNVSVNSGLEITDWPDDQLVNYNGNADLTVTAKANPGVDISYTWYDENWDEIEGEESKTLSLTGIKKTTRYRCEVSDQYDNTEDTGWIRVKIDTGLDLRSNGPVFRIRPDESCKLIVDAAANDGVELNYKWQKHSSDRWVRVRPDDPAKPAELTVANLKKSHVEYRCVVSDGYGNEEDARFDIYLDTGLNVEYEEVIEAAPGSSQKIKLNVTSDYDDNTYKFKWYRDDGDKRIGTYDTAFAGADTDELTIKKVEAADEYRCVVRDKYGCEETAYIRLKVENHLKISNDSQTVSINEGSSKDLKVNVSADDKTGMIYNWEANLDDGSMVDYGTNNSDTLTVSKAGNYECVVRDRYGNTAWAFFRVVINGGLKLTYDRQVSVKANNTVTLKVTAQTQTPAGLKYSWSIWENETYKTVNTTAGSYSFKPQVTQQVSVKVTDGCNTEYGYIRVTVDSGLTAAAQQETVTVSPGGTASLKVNASTQSGNALTYEWYDDDDELIKGAASASYSFKPKKTCKYYCRVSDGYNYKNVHFTVRVNSGLTVSGSSNPAASGGVITVVPNTPVTLTVNASGGTGRIITYDWNEDYDNDGNSMTITKPYSGTFTCTVNDGVDTQTVSFKIKVNSGFQAAAYYKINGGAKKSLSEDYVISAHEGDELTLISEASTQYGEVQTYWYDYYYGVPFAEDSTCTLTVTEDMQMRWHAFDDYNGEGFEFEIKVIRCEHKSLTKTDSAAATCQKEGNTAYWTCNDCGAVFSDSGAANQISLEDTVVPKTDHTWGDWTVLTEAACTKTGLKERRCSVCGSTEQEVIPEKGHKLAVTEAVPAGCETEGSIEFWACSECGTMYKTSAAAPADEITAEDIGVAPLGQDWGEWTEVTPATEEAEGLERRECKRDETHFEERPIPMLGHVHELERKAPAAATCEEPGNDEYYVCTGCGRLFADAEGTIPLNAEDVFGPATGHDWGAWTVKTPATCLAAGEEIRVCGNDETHFQTRPIEKLDHKLTKTERKEATHTEEGNIEYWTCSECHQIFADAAGTIAITIEDTVIPKDPNPVPDVDPITPGEQTADEAEQDTSIPAVSASKIITAGNVSKKTMTVKFPVAAVDNYRIQYRKAGATKWTSRWTSGKGNVTLSKMAANGMYQVRVAGYVKQDDGSWKRGKWTTFYRLMTTTKISRLKPGKKSLTVTWARKSGVKGYVIQYSLKSTMKSSKTITVKGASKVKYTIKRLKKGKLYYVRVRPYKVKSGKNYIGIYSGKKKARAK